MKFLVKFLLFFSIFTVMSYFLENILIALFLFLISPFARFMGASILSNQISIGGNFLLLAKECTGSMIYNTYLAFAFSYKFSKERIKYLLIGLVLLMFLNFIRIISLIGVAALSFPGFRLVHNFLWPASFFIFTLLGVTYYKNEADK